MRNQTFVLLAALAVVALVATGAAATDYGIGVQVAHACGMVNNGTGKPGGTSDPPDTHYGHRH